MRWHLWIHEIDDITSSIRRRRRRRSRVSGYEPGCVVRGKRCVRGVMPGIYAVRMGNCESEQREEKRIGEKFCVIYIIYSSSPCILQPSFSSGPAPSCVVGVSTHYAPPYPVLPPPRRPGDPFARGTISKRGSTIYNTGEARTRALLQKYLFSLLSGSLLFSLVAHNL